MKDLTNEINELVQKHLPAHVGETLLARFKELAEKETMLERTTARNIDLEKENNRLKQVATSESQLERDKIKLVNDRLALEQIERDMKVTILEKELALAKESRDEIKGLVNSLFRNIEFRSNMFGSQSFGLKNQYGSLEVGSGPKSENTSSEPM